MKSAAAEIGKVFQSQTRVFLPATVYAPAACHKCLGKMPSTHPSVLLVLACQPLLSRGLTVQTPVAEKAVPLAAEHHLQQLLLQAADANTRSIILTNQCSVQAVKTALTMLSGQ